MLLSPDDATVDLDAQLTALHAMGPMEFEPGEREQIAAVLDELNLASQRAMDAIAGRSS